MILVDSMATKNKKIWRSTVRMDKVLGCLKWLKENNPLYSDINILDSDDPCVQQLLDMVFHEISVEDEEDLDATADKGKEVAKVAGIEVDSDAERPAAIRHVDEEERMGLDIQSYSVTKLQADQPICSDSELYCKVQIMADPSKDAKNLVYKCFPSLFPRARNGPAQDSERQTRVSEQQLLRALYNNATEDGRKFREHKNFLFFLQNERNRKDQNNGVYASMNMMRVPQNMSTAKDFVDKLKRKDGGVESCIANSFAQIPGTKEYWNRQRNNLIALQQTYGSPTWFLTLSCAEYLWADIAQRLKMRNPHLANASINQLLSADPMGFAEQFKLRVESFFDKVILARQTRDKIGPLGKVSHYFWRYEYQMRGAPHIHCLLWVESAPILKEDCSNKDDVLKYIDEHITCRLPANDDMDNATLLQLVARFQKHTCTGSCLRQRRMFGGRNISFCRYHFPRPARSETLLRSAAESVKSRMRKSRPKKLYDLKRGFDESHINDYNPAILLAWEANMDLQYVGDESMVLVKYVTGYVGKHDKGSTADVWSVMNRDAEVKSRLWKYSAEIFKNREIGQNEAADRILGNQLYKFSYGDSPIFLNTRPITMRYRRLKPISKAENLAKEGSSLESLFSNQYPEDYYTRRPDTWEDVYLYECFRNWRYAGEDKRGKDKTNVAYDWPKENKSQDVNRRTDEEDADVLALIGGTGESDYEEEEGEDIAHEDGDVAGKTERKKGPTDYVKLKSEAGCLKKRFKPCVVATSWYNIRQPDQKELQYRALLMLFKPWRKEADLKGNAETWEQAWMEWDTSNPNAAWRKDYVALKTVIDVTEKIQKFEDEVELEEALAAEKDKQTTTGKVNQVDPDELLEQMDVHDGEQLEDEPVEIPQAYNLTTAEVKKMESRLNAGQREVYDKVIGAIEHQKKCTAEKKDTCPDCVPLREIVSGVGGTGKSFLIEGPFINYVSIYNTSLKLL